MRSYAKYVVSVGLIIPSIVNAVGLGNLNVQSTLNQPLNAYIDLSLDEGTLLDGVKVRLADTNAFQKAGIDRPYFLSQLTFKTITFHGRSVIQVSSTERINNPFINILLDVSWAKGQLYRSYTILLDPPGYQMALNVEDTPPSVAPRKTYKYRYQKNKPVAKHFDISKDSIASIYGPTKKTDDLWDISLKYKPQNATMNQVMLGIIRLNPTAFIRGNINSLKTNVKLKIPTAQFILATNRKQALREVNSHMDAWKNKTDINHVIDLSNPPSLNTENAPEVANDMMTTQKADTENNTNNSDNSNNFNEKRVDLEGIEEINSNQSVLDEVQNEAYIKQKIKPADTEIVDEVEIAESDKMAITPKPKVIKEKLFDDFITIPKVLKKIVKHPSSSGVAGSTDNNNFTINTVDKPSMPVKKDLTPEVAVAISAIETVKDSNQLLRQQVQALTKQNELLAKQLQIESKQDESVRRKIDMLMKIVEKDYLLSGDGNLIRKDSVGQQISPNDDSFSFLSFISYLILLLIAGGGATFAYVYIKQQRSREVSNILDEELMTIYEDKLTEESTEESVPHASMAPKKYNEAVISATDDSRDTDKVEETNRTNINNQQVIEGIDEVEEELTNAHDAKYQSEISHDDNMTKTEEPRGFEPLDIALDPEEDLADLAKDTTNESDENVNLDKENAPLEFESIKIETPVSEVECVKEEPSSKLDDYSLELELVDNKPDSESVEMVEEARQAIEDKPTTHVNISTQIALAETYIAMEDWQSAKDSLETVLNEGNKAQAEKASKLLELIPQ